jgi:class 3 adenylate cyclase/tetratricopeptide (TPR) repeat protein
MTEREQLEGGIAALEAQRAVLGDAVVDTALAALRARLARLDTPEQQLRPVTILFADVVGSTSVSQQLDPEDIHALMDGALQSFTSIIESRRGRVLQYAGDSVLAVFGSLEAREDDAERAVRTGLEILAEAGRLGLHARGRHGPDDFNVRVGIHTGPVLLGGGVDADGSIRGIAVNIAARMEQAAPAGRLRISHTTYRHVRSLFEVSEEPPLSVKGISVPVRSYIVLGPRAGAVDTGRRGLDGIEAPLIGRDAELASLIDTFETVRAERTPSVVVLVADAGLGKTRLMSEFERWLERRPEPVSRFYGRAQSYSTDVPYGLVRALFASRFEIRDDDPQTIGHAKLTAGLAACLGDRREEHVALIGHLIGFDYSASPYIAGIAGDGRQLRDRAFQAVSEYFRHVHRQSGEPIVVLLDDLHWADDGSLDLVDHVAQTCRGVPILLLCLARPELVERRPSWTSGRSHRERLDLGPLSEQSSRELVESLLLRRLASLPHAVREVVAGHADGNPFFIEELVAMLVDDGIILTDGEHWDVAADRLVDVPIPSTLAGVLQARLDALPAGEKTALQHASVIGHVFWDEPLERITPGTTGALRGLVQRDLVRVREPSAFDGVREYVFKHHLLHQVTYDGVLRGAKRQQHREVAQWLEARSADRSESFYGRIADHYQRAADTESAATYWRRAGDVAARTYAIGAAVGFFGRALDLIPPGELELRYGVMTSRVHMLNLGGPRSEEESLIVELERLAETLNDDGKRAGAASLRARLAVCTGDYATAASSSARALTLAGDGGHTSIVLLARSVWASASIALGDYAGARVQADALLRAAREAGNERRMIDALHLQGNLAKSEGRYGVAREYFAQALERARALLDTVFESIQLCNLGETEKSVGNYTAATDRLEAGLRLGRDLGFGIAIGHCLIELTEVAQAQGDSAAALAHVSDGLAIAREMPHRELEACLLVVQGDAESSLGRPIEALATYGRALELLRERELGGAALEAVAGLARTALALGDVDGAVAHVARIEVAIDVGREPNRAPGLLWTCYTVLDAARSPRARDVLVRAHALLTERAKLLEERDRVTFLGNVPWHRAIINAWACHDHLSAGSVN